MKTFNKLQLSTILTGTLLTIGLCNFTIAEPSVSEAGSSSSLAAESSTTENQSLKFKISGRINDMYPGNNIEVTVFNHQVLLTGQVLKANVKDAAAKAANELAPNYKVFNYLDIGQLQPSEQTRKDALITVKATSKLLSVSGVQTGNIKVVTTHSVVYLMGNVTKSQSTAIINNTKLIKDVGSIINLFQYSN